MTSQIGAVSEATSSLGKASDDVAVASITVVRILSIQKEAPPKLASASGQRRASEAEKKAATGKCEGSKYCSASQHPSVFIQKAGADDVTK
jgi:hypothetical protein